MGRASDRDLPIPYVQNNTPALELVFNDILGYVLEITPLLNNSRKGSGKPFEFCFAS
jgi:hypothetical protein